MEKKYFIYVIIALFIFFLLRQIKFKAIKKTFKMKELEQLNTKINIDLSNLLNSENFKDFNIKYSDNLDKDIIAYIKYKEGGLTDNSNDSASKFPTGVVYTYKGKTTDKWHTNAGITWQTFKDSIPNATAEKFYKMSDSDWLTIYNKNYKNAFATYTTNPLINYELSLWAWGSGVSGAKALLNYVNLKYRDFKTIIEKYPSLAFDILVIERILFYKRLAEKNPKNKVFLKGWINAHLNFYKHFKKYI